jgi:hypothetical protein
VLALGARSRRFESDRPDFVKLVAAFVCAAVLAAAASGATGPVFRSSIRPISATLARQMIGVSWRTGCPVPLRDLRAVSASYRSFDGGVHTGTLIVHRDVAAQVVVVLRKLFVARFPIRRLEPVDAFGGSDYASIERCLSALPATMGA